MDSYILFGRLNFKSVKQLINDQVNFFIQHLIEFVNVTFALIPRRGKLIDVKLRLPLPFTISLEGSYTLPITLVRQPIYAISVSGCPSL